MKILKGKLVIDEELDQLTLSKSGKSFIVLSSAGFKDLPSDDGKEYSININVIQKR